MRSPSLALFLVLTIGAIAANAAPAPPKPSKWQLHEQELFKNSAPADRYFGRMKMSYLGMNNTFRDSAISAGDHTTNAGIVGKVALAEDALEDWGRKYPRDPQLARTYFLALQVERKLWLKPNQDRAWVVLNRLAHDFPKTYFGKLAQHDLAIGFTEHYYALPVPCPTPTASDDEAAAATLTPAPTPSAAPTATPTPGPVETTLSRGLRTEMLPQPCVPPPSPPPTPSPTPSTAPAPAVEAPSPAVT